MTMARRPLIAGNWKMNGLEASLRELDSMRESYSGALAATVDLLVCPPATLLREAARLAEGSGIRVGAQDCHPKASGAHTGDISAEMIRDAGATAVVVGHSERRTDHGETDAVVRAKAEAAWRAGLLAVVCVGESRGEREAGQAETVVGKQIAGSVPDGATADRLVVAYEPIWAIGTGLTPTREDVGAIHRAIRGTLRERFGPAGEAVRVLYGGSVKPDNAKQILLQDDVDGALVGGASLKALDFIGIATAYN